MVKIAQINVKTIRKNLLKPPLSATAPSIGERTATIIAERAIEFAHIVVPKFSSGAITFIKNALYIKETTIVVKGWFAKSYNDHANTSFLFLNLNRLIFLVKTNIKQFIQKITYTYPLKNYTFAILKLLQ